jgi:hypothetical protein
MEMDTTQYVPTTEAMYTACDDWSLMLDDTCFKVTALLLVGVEEEADE